MGWVGSIGAVMGFFVIYIYVLYYLLCFYPLLAHPVISSKAPSYFPCVPPLFVAWQFETIIINVLDVWPSAMLALLEVHIIRPSVLFSDSRTGYAGGVEIVP